MLTNQDKLALLKPFLTQVIKYTNRVAFAKPYLQQAKVLDIGFVDHEVAHARKLDNFIHDDIRALASSVVGLDTAADEVAALQAAGYTAIIGDIEDAEQTAHLIQTHGLFDVIFAGELIEHILNIRSFFQNCHQLLQPHGLLIISTPNALGFPFSMGVLKTGSSQGINETHTLWFDPLTLLTSLPELGFTLKNFAWCQDVRYLQANHSLLSKLYFWVYRRLTRWRPYFSEGFIIVLEKV